MKLRQRTIADLVALQRGHDLTEQEREEGVVPVIGSAGQNGWHKEAIAKGPGVTIGRSGGSIGKVTFVEQDFWPHNTCIYVTDFKGNDPRFVAYLLGTLDLAQLNSGAAQPSLNRNFVYPFRVSYPEPETQRKIARTLAAYDDLIDNNRRRIALLEESARLLYREWFVRLRFPGHEHTRIVDGVPKGWVKKALGDLCVEVRESVHPDALEPDTPYIGLEHMPRRSISLGEWGKAEQVTSSKHRFREGEILFGKIRPYFHKVGVAFVDGVASSDAIVIRPRDVALHSLVLMAVSSDEFVAVTSQAMKEGSKMPRADWRQMLAYPVPLPPPGLLSTFDGVIQPIVAQLKTLTLANQKLRTARDLLLPKLMSGELIPA